MHERRRAAERARPREERDGGHAVLGARGGDLRGLLGGVHVQGEPAPPRLRRERRNPRLRAGPDGVRRDPEGHEWVARDRRREVVEPGEERVRRGLDEAALERIGRERMPGARVAGAEQRDADADRARGAHDAERELGGVRVGAPFGIAVEVVELAGGRHARAGELVEGHPGDHLEVVGVEPVRGLVHGAAPGPEVLPRRAPPLGAPADRALERVPVRRHEPGQHEHAAEAHGVGPARRLADRRDPPRLDDERGARVQHAPRVQDVGQVGARRGHGGGLVGGGAPRYDAQPMALAFVKYHGLGNDFVVVDGPLMDADRARRLCNRRRGIGADGVLTVLSPRTPGAAATMHIYNADGSVAAMCGNGIRCVARHLAETRGIAGEIVIDTDSGPKRCLVHHGVGGAFQAVSVEMGPARLLGEQAFLVNGESLAAMRVSMGNPHAVLFDLPHAPAGVHGRARDRADRRGGRERRVRAAGPGRDRPRGLGARRRPHRRVRHRCVRGGGRVGREGRRAEGGADRGAAPGRHAAITVGDDLERVVMRGPAERVFAGETDL